MKPFLFLSAGVAAIIILAKLSECVDLDYLNGELVDTDRNEFETNGDGNFSMTADSGRRAAVPIDNYTSTSVESTTEQQVKIQFRKPKNEVKKTRRSSTKIASNHLRKATKSTINLFHFQYNDYEVEVSTDDADLRKYNVNAVAAVKLSLANVDSRLAKKSDAKHSQDFVNLEPAIDSFNITKEVDMNKTIIWYVPEKFPCWDLPILYGELGHRKSLEKVFLMNPVVLKNVIDNEKLKMMMYDETFLIDVGNKWCNTAPCYGDHTLCLFSKKLVAPICGAGYYVKIPSVLERSTLVNVVNSLRNHVAKGSFYEYPYLPPAANMKQILYDFDLEHMSSAWLSQCLPGPAPCSSLDWKYVAELECTKYAKRCCVDPPSNSAENKCVPEEDCFIHPIVGCIYAWFEAAGSDIDSVDVKCGNVEATTYSTIQLLWAKTNKIGCACGYKNNGDVRVVCHFSPGAPFVLKTDYYCGILAHRDVQSNLNEDVVSLSYLKKVGIDLDPIPEYNFQKELGNRSIRKQFTENTINRGWGVISLQRIYAESWARKQLNYQVNGTKGLVARLVVKYRFEEDSNRKCDTDVPVYEIGEPASTCMETGRKFEALCYDFGEVAMGYRLVAVLAPVALFTLIMYDLFSGVMRQANN